MSIEKFVAQFQVFSANPVIAPLTESSKVTLFQVYCQGMVKPPAPAQSQPTAAKKPTEGPPASPKQIGLIRSLINDGSLDAGVLKNRLTIKEASILIEKGLANRNSAPVEEEEPVPVPQDADYAGAFNWGGV